MNRWISLFLITAVLLAATQLQLIAEYLHEAYSVIVLFFAIQTFALLRIDVLIPEEWKVQSSLIKIVIRFLSSAVFILVTIYQYADPMNLVIQFILIYLVYMIFEIGVALTNLRRN